jgi:hypothetical protein
MFGDTIKLLLIQLSHSIVNAGVKANQEGCGVLGQRGVNGVHIRGDREAVHVDLKRQAMK